ncbi:MAG: 3-oxoacyl-ACP synthase [Planctomycetes bacterium DG_58]|nr:MAG: 3-oxoacyl-ACP synthase [Planctomycetes bacterium DG_58]KPL01381.1 MAG: 3-oxoacyl-ACP synthase [Planctomycetes bacterium SM23_65]
MTGDIRAVITGTGSFLPDKILTNEDFERMVDTSDEWITTRTGIKTRHIADGGMTTSDMASAAGKRALRDAGVKPKDVELVIVATFTGDRPLPACACFVQEKLGLENAGAFDLAAACSGFVYGTASAWGLIASGIYRNILVIGADHLSAFTDYTDRTSCILFGDGAGAALVQAAPNETERGILTCSLGADGGGADMMTVYAGGSELPTSEETVRNRRHYMVIRGREVFKFAALKMQELVKASVEACHLTIDDVKLVVPHQVNTRILNFAAEKLGLPKEKLYVNIDRVANTSAASIPIALDEAAQAGMIETGDVIVLVAFGGGLTWASMVLRW